MIWKYVLRITYYTLMILKVIRQDILNMMQYIQKYVYFWTCKIYSRYFGGRTENRWSSFEALTEKEGVIKTYRLHKITKANCLLFVPDMLSYLNNAKESGQIVGDWCSFVAIKRVCLKLFLHKESVAK